MWEVLSMGAQPFEWLANNEVASKVSKGERLPRPIMCTDSLYSLLNLCMSIDPDQRPPFSEVKLTLFFEKHMD